MAHGSAWIWMAGALVALFGLATTVPGARGLVGGAAAAVGCCVGAAITWRYGSTLPERYYSANMLGGAVAVPMLVIVSPQLSDVASFTFIWFALYACIFFRGTVQRLQYATTAAGALLCTFISGTPEVFLLAIVTIAVSLAFVGALVTHLERETRIDPLTNLPNRRAWEERIQLEMDRARESGTSLCVGMIDLDHFKRYNDEHGHAGGDALLVEVAEAWPRTLRPDDMVARLGGEEFGVMLPACAISDGAVILKRLHREVRNGVTSSVGVAQWDREESAAILMARADVALYQAKRAGRDQVKTASLTAITL